MSEQLAMFKEYIGKLKNIVGEDRTKFILDNSFFLVVAGSDDIANTYFIARVRQLQYDIPAYTDLMLHSASDFVKVGLTFFNYFFFQLLFNSTKFSSKSTPKFRTNIIPTLDV